MNELDIQALPLLPLTTGVVLPGMVVTLTIESDEARAADRRHRRGRRRAPHDRAPGGRSVRPRRRRGQDRGRRAHAQRRRGRGHPRTQARHRRPRCPRDRRGDVGAARARGRARERSSPRARQGVSRGRRGDHGRSRRSRGRRVPARRDRPGPAGGHLRVLAGPLLRAEGGGARDARRRGEAREGAPRGPRRRSRRFR